MIKTILATTAIILTTATSALAGPSVYAISKQTPYGQFGCMQRSQNKLFAIGATNITPSSNSVWGDFGSNSIVIWCRGSEAIVITSGPDSAALKNEVSDIF